ncbi:SDR family NAD(P)-dependent oxidoreductase [Paraburkholderia phymatum]|uniref:SDR family NAD(P)-dependent oxidoreductase n=1 Tax=Paraburkholderia phymatum TaxID=148447 RepID=UPI0031829316
MTRYSDLAGKTVLVTGASKALGAETARAFAKEGARVAVNGRDVQSIESVVASIRDAGGDAVGIAADVTNADDIDRLRASVTERFGSPDILACYAGGLGYPIPVLELDEAGWRRTLDADLTSKFLTVRAFAPAMCERGSGAIILMSSASGRLVSEASAAYGAAQAGTLMLMRHLAQELGPSGVRVNAIAPSIVRNEKIDRNMPPELQRKVAESRPIRRLGEPRDIAEAALFLASSASSLITGQVLDVNGGKVMV